MGLPGGKAIDLTVHIDTMVLRALILPSENPDMHNEAKKWLPPSNQPPLKVSHVAIGEAFAGIAGKGRMSCEGFDCAMIEFNRLSQNGRYLDVKGIPDVKRYHETALELHRIDNRLEPNDCLLLSLALVDHECVSFLTSDPTMVKSQRLMDLARSLDTAIAPFGEKRVDRKRRKRYAGRTIK